MTHQHAGRYVLKKPVFFIGFMGAGKTSVSQQIAVTCGLASIDADEYLEFREDRIIADILRDLTRRSPRLIGCGGGVVSKRPENAQIMKEAGFVVYLKVSADAAAARIPNTESRPMFKNLDTARKTIVERAPQYEAAADVEIETENRSIREVAEEVVAVLLDRGIMIDQRKA